MISLRPQDVLVSLKLALHPDQPWAFSRLANELGLSASEAHSSIKRAGAAGLVQLEERRVRARNLLEFLEHGIQYAFVPSRGPVTRGVPTAHSASPLVQELMPGASWVASTPLGKAVSASSPHNAPLDELPMVWAHPNGAIRGESIEPLYPSAVDAALRDPKLHEGLALVDALRIERSRERNLALRFLKELVGVR